ncbi:LysR family transcriptional regulator [Mesorhizobium sp. 1B3]|uniref:LysR family transcriptional regulator n=1 Tax=Mesorhizobium sp. 1B3 TaxID=3243599 RepID=UPI003D978033
MPALLDSDLLRTFVAIADTGNFTRAAEHVGRTQSAISMQMKRLEATVGAALFERGSRGVKLTIKGDQLLVNARRVVGMLEEASAAIAAPPLQGPVRIGIPEEYGYSVLSRALAAFAKLHRNVEVTTRYGHSAHQMAELKEGKLDLAVVFEWRPSKRGEILLNDPTVWVTSNVHCIHEGNPVPVALYENSRWSREFAIKSLERCGIDYRVACRSDNSAGLMLAVESGLAIAPVSRSNIPSGCRELTVADGFDTIDSSNVVLHRNRGSKGAAVDGMADAIREAFRARPAELP